MTVDHTYVQFLLLIGAITPEEAAVHPRRHVILRALGISPKPEVEVAPQPIPVRAGDVILLCTDGLTNMLSDGEIERIITSEEPLQRRADRLIQAANEAGGEDNITVLLVEFE
jgi:protein phosphatase